VCYCCLTRWLDLARKFDQIDLAVNEIYIQSDYAAQVTFESQDKLNSQGHGVGVLNCWVVLHSPEIREYKNELNQSVKYRHYECDHIRVVSPAKGKGKDQDWYLHTKVFDYLMDYYKNKIPNLNRVILWTDGAVTQYKCRQIFWYVTKGFAKHKVPIVHRFAATAQFKGIHDKVGQVAKAALS